MAHPTGAPSVCWGFFMLYKQGYGRYDGINATVWIISGLYVAFGGAAPGISAELASCGNMLSATMLS